MGYSQNPLNVLKGQMTNKAVGLAHGNSMAMQKDPRDGDKLPSYETTTYNASASGSDGGSSSQNLSTSNLKNYQKELKDLGPNFKPTPEQTATANAEVARLKALDKANAATKAANRSQSSSESISTSTTTLGNQTLNQIKKAGNIEVQNRASRVNATREAARNQAVIDSTNTANKFISSKPISIQDNPALINAAQRRGNLAAKRSLLRSKAYNTSTISNMVKKGENYLGTE